MNTAFLLTGGNLGNRVAILEEALEHLSAKVGKVSACSSLYETAAWGNTEQPSFLNQVVKVETVLTARGVLEISLAIERQMGRTREEKYGPRTIDIDLLLFNNQIIHEPGLIVPHPHMQDRRFVLVPLCELAPDLVHPIWGKTMIKLLQSCPDQLPVNKYSPGYGGV